MTESPKSRPADCVFRRPMGRRRRQGFSFLELMIVMAIIAVLSSMGLPLYLSSVKLARDKKVVGEMKTISLAIDMYMIKNGKYPSSLDEVGYGTRKDPWGNDYQFLNIADDLKGKGKCRKDKFLVPINTDYDLYSMGPDGKSVTPLTAKASRDDIIRANDGAYYGPASKY